MVAMLVCTCMEQGWGQGWGQGGGRGGGVAVDEERGSLNSLTCLSVAFAPDDSVTRPRLCSEVPSTAKPNSEYPMVHAAAIIQPGT